jgi:acyl dehydratase
MHEFYENLRSRIGEEAVYLAPEPVGAAAIRYYALALDDDNLLYRDAAFAASTRFGGVIAPPTLVCETNQYMSTKLAANGYLGHQWTSDTPGVRMLRAGNEYEFFSPMRPDDQLRVTWKLAEVQEKQGRSGPLVFAISEITYENADGRLIARNRETNVYQPVTSVGTGE